MKKVFGIAGLLFSVLILNGCGDNGEQFVGNWKAISTADGKHVFSDDRADRKKITCKDGGCHIVSTSLSLGIELISESDWVVGKNSTLVAGGGLETLYFENGKIRGSNRIYEKQKE